MFDGAWMAPIVSKAPVVIPTPTTSDQTAGDLRENVKLRESLSEKLALKVAKVMMSSETLASDLPALDTLELKNKHNGEAELTEPVARSLNIHNFIEPHMESVATITPNVGFDFDNTIDSAIHKGQETRQPETISFIYDESKSSLVPESADSLELNLQETPELFEKALDDNSQYNLGRVLEQREKQLMTTSQVLSQSHYIPNNPNCEVQRATYLPYHVQPPSGKLKSKRLTREPPVSNPDTRK